MQGYLGEYIVTNCGIRGLIPGDLEGILDLHDRGKMVEVASRRNKRGDCRSGRVSRRRGTDGGTRAVCRCPVAALSIHGVHAFLNDASLHRQ